MRKRTHIGLISILLGVSVGSWAGCSDGIVDAPLPPPPPSGGILVRTATRGLLPDPDGYRLEVDGTEHARIRSNDSVTVPELEAGEHEIHLTDVSSDCAVAGSNPRLVLVGSGISSTSFNVECTGPRLTLTSVSGQVRVGRPGEPLPEPLVVQVTDSAGRSRGGMTVNWSIRGGDGTLHLAWRGVAVREMSSSTDTAGLAQVPVIPLGFDSVEVEARLSGAEGSPVTFLIDATDPRATLAMVSGSDQPARAGQPLADPLVVRVMDGQGEPVSHIVVAWTVHSGDGDLGRDAWGDRIGQATVRTDAEGLARVRLTPTWFGPVEVSASAAGVDGPPVTFRTDATDAGAGLALVSGDGQVGKTAERLAERLVVRVSDGLGDPAANVRVDWRVAQGSGGFGRIYWGSWDDPESYAHAIGEESVYTDAEGLASVYFSPRSLGSVEIEAELGGGDSTAAFTADVETLVIHYGWAPWVGLLFDDVLCVQWLPTQWAQASCAESAVPLGTTVEWVSHLAGARIMSTSRPPDGAAFDSGPMASEERFEFTAEVAGTWEYVDRERGVRSSLRVY